MKNTLQPKLRFPEFEGEWTNDYIKNTFTISAGGDINKENVSEILTDEFKYPIYANAEKEKGFYAYSNLYKIEPPSLTVAGRGVNIGIAHFRNERYYPIVRLLTLKSSKENISYSFFEYELNRINYYVESTGVPQLTAPQIDNYKICFPSLPEQQKIADYLTTIDRKIELLEEKKTELSRYKKAMMQKLFSQELRFKDEQGNDFPDWESVQLKDVLSEHKEKNKNNKLSEVVSVAKEKGVINQIEHLGRSYAAEKIDHYKVVNPFDIVYTKSPTSGFPFGIIKQNKLNRSAVLSPLYAVFRPKTKYIGMILHDLFTSEIETYNYLVPLVQKGAKNTMNINNDDFLNGKRYCLPTSEKEQQKIAEFLSTIDESIDKVEEQVKETKLFKKAMLQQMFV